MVLGNMLREMTNPVRAWDELPPPWGPEIPRRRCTIADIDSARNACELLKGVIDSSTECACIRLARSDYAKETRQHWGTQEEFEVTHFGMNWGVFSKSYKMWAPIENDRLRLSPIRNLTCKELSELRGLLRDLLNQEIWVADAEQLKSDPRIWVCK
ncbi:hypothetical protein M758_UG070300 [Ceratodon purpureus]|nr:hypothetical protein M758_UG070300 [Ceratodon purpureus]